MQSTFTVKLKFKRFLCHVLDLSSIDQSGISVSTTFIVWRIHIPKHQIDHYSTVRLQRGNLCIFSTGFLFDTKKSSSVCIHCPWFYPQFIDHQASDKFFYLQETQHLGFLKWLRTLMIFMCEEICSQCFEKEANKVSIFGITSRFFSFFVFDWKQIFHK